MESVVFGPEDQVLSIRCVDGRTEAPVCGVLPPNLHQLRFTGGILAPLVGARNNKKLLPILADFFFDQILTAIEVKHPVAIVIVTHSDCGAVKMLGIDDGQVADYLQMIVGELIKRGVTQPIYGAYDNHCRLGIRRVFEKVLVANKPPKVRQLVASAA